MVHTASFLSDGEIQLSNVTGFQPTITLPGRIHGGGPGVRLSLDKVQWSPGVTGYQDEPKRTDNHLPGYADPDDNRGQVVIPPTRTRDCSHSVQRKPTVDDGEL